MRADLDELLAGSSSEPRAPLDVDELWSAGRRRRRVRRLSAVTGGVASVAAVVVAVSAIGLSGPSSPEVAPLDEPDGSDDTEVAETDETGDVDDSAPTVSSDETEAETGTGTDDSEATGDETRDGDGPDETVDESAELADEPAATDEPATPTPDAGAMDDPCAAHDADDIRAFIDVVSPVAGQSIGGAIELVGCSSVYEGTVRYRVLDGDEVLVDHFTTATAGGPALGEFRETIVVDRGGSLTLEVFWDSPADGSEQDLVQLTIQGS